MNKIKTVYTDVSIKVLDRDSNGRVVSERSITYGATSQVGVKDDPAEVQESTYLYCLDNINKQLDNLLNK